MYTLAHPSARTPHQPELWHTGESFGDACRHCGSTLIIVEPPSSSGRCAVCSHEAVAWAARRAEVARRRARARRRLF
jgi:hypothetical protein